MSRINPQCLERLATAPTSGAGMAEIFQKLASMGIGYITLDYQREEDEVVEGDLVPVITLSLRPATLKEPDNLDALVSRAKGVEVSAEEKEEQRVSFAFGNCKIDNEEMDRETVARESQKLKEEANDIPIDQR